MSCSPVPLLCIGLSVYVSAVTPCPPIPLPDLDLNGLEVDAGVHGVQMAVQGMEGGPLGGLWVPAIHHNAIDVGGTPTWTGQPVACRQELQHLLIALSCVCVCVRSRAKEREIEREKEGEE